MTTEEDTVLVNNQLLLISGKSTAGKSASLRNIRDQESWIYFNFEAGKQLPFRNKFNIVNMTDPEDIFDYMEECIENQDQMSGMIFDSITFMLEMYESLYVYGMADGRAGWGDFQQYWKKLVQSYIPRFKKPVIMTAHVFDLVGEKGIIETAIPVKGALAKNGIEAYFSMNIMAAKMPLKDVTKYKNDLFTVTEDEEDYGTKYVFQTRPVAGNSTNRIRAPMGLWKREETYIDNDAQAVIDRLSKFYA